MNSKSVLCTVATQTADAVLCTKKRKYGTVKHWLPKSQISVELEKVNNMTGQETHRVWMPEWLYYKTFGVNVINKPKPKAIIFKGMNTNAM